MFGRFKNDKSTLVWLEDEDEVEPEGQIIDSATGIAVDASCNTTITIHCLQQIYNAVGYRPLYRGNSIGVTAYLEQYANHADLQTFYADQRPEALGSSFKFISVHGTLIYVNKGHVH
jgi:tripeptidyl-peptidase-1